MANRRMFSKDITNSDEFLDMPLSSQSLYFHLGMNADDDGFVCPRSIIRLIQAKDDDLKILAAKGFIIHFKTSVIVITHWKTNNEIKKDRYRPTVYQEHLEILGLNNGKYCMDTKCIQNVSKMDTQVRLGKDSIGKINTTADKSADEINLLINEFKTINPTINFGNKTYRSSLRDLIKKLGLDQTRAIIQYAVSVQGKPYTPTITNPYQLKIKLGDLKVYAEKQKAKSPATI
jgi:hypothetical protein